MISLDAYRQAFAHLPEGVREAEVNVEIHNILSLTVSDGVREDVQVSESAELFLRASGEKTGYVYTQNLMDDPETLIRQAYENSFCSDREVPEEMAREQVRNDFGAEEAERDLKTVEAEALKIAAWLERELRIPDTKLTLDVDLQAETYGQLALNSHGMESRSIRPLCMLYVFAGAEQAGNEAEAAVTLTSRTMDGFDLPAAAEDLRERLQMQLLPKGEFTSGEYPAILSREFVYNLMATAWQSFSGVKYVQGATAFQGRLGEKIGPECLSITDYRAVERSGYEMNCDAEGTPGVDVPILQNGVLTGLMTNQTTAAQMGIRPTGNAGRRPLLTGNISTDLLVTPKNFCIEPGTASLSEMMAHMEEGILLTEHSDLYHSLDVASGDFSIPCYGVQVEKGRPVGSLTGLTVSGNLGALFKGVQEVECLRLIRPMDYTNNYGIGACGLRVDRLSISGE